MKRLRPVHILLAALLAGVLAFFAARSWPTTSSGKGILLDDMNELAWLKEELSLTDAQFAGISELHHAYRPRCVEMCRRIDEAEWRLAALASGSRTMTPELAAAIQDSARVRAECQQAMIEHLQQTAALLDPAQAEKYLAAMLPLAIGASTSATGNACH